MISIVTVCHKSDQILARYVSSFLEHHADALSREKIEFVLVENSGDDSVHRHAQTLRTAGFRVRVEMVENRGFGAGCNEGAALAEGELLAFVNPDITFQSNLLPLEPFFGTDSWGGLMHAAGKPRTHPLYLRPEYVNTLTELARTTRWIHKVPALYRYAFPSGSFFIVPSAAFHHVGGFDERFFMYFEEAELGRRLLAHLGPPCVCKSVTVSHKGFGTQSSMEKTMAFEAESTLVYADIIGDPDLPRRRLSTLRSLGRIVPINARRAYHLKQAIEAAAHG